MRPVVVADSGPLIALAGCSHLMLLTEIFGAVHLPQTVLMETTADLGRPGARDIARFVQKHVRVHPDRNDTIYTQAAAALDEGEAQAISLARALQCGVLMDERCGRAAARRLGLPIFGVLGVLVQARRQGRIEALAPLLQQLQTNGYRIAPALITAALEAVGEA
ncbi:DUF3368 domain-containing protein [Pseudothauera nasutitermitis]|uniref:DUF3368 domain-containing protein n=1 Tax=Pseudothauera nasutitermitis TaxID=2565930 RepID=A0A4S4AXW6_9RHOO|nr:DUF3368 domain-containing protein [Pseudothauera nasutitermitis]THF64790.1 DUF3368 domain-containing protein [Pseudothauera nasutitermitis]